MKANYNINHLLLDSPIFQKPLTPTQHQALLITFSYVAHWCKWNGGVCEFKQGSLSRDWRIKPHFFAQSLKILQEAQYIKKVKSWSKDKQTSAHYKLDRAYTPFAQKLYPREAQAIPQGGILNNINNIIKGDDVNTSPPLQKNETLSSTPDTIVWKNHKP